MKTFSITTLGCRVNHYESGQLAALLRQHGLGHHQDVNRELTRLLTGWEAEERASSSLPTSLHHGNARSNEHDGSESPEPVFDDGWMTKQAGTPAGLITRDNEPQVGLEVNGK